MVDLKKYNGTEWVDTTLRQYKTATDTLTTLPADIYADGNNATVGLKGNTIQNGTPSPDNPIMPEGTGERTGNLVEPFENYTWTPSNCIIVSNMNNQMLLDGNGYTGSLFSQAMSTSKSIPLSLIGETVTFSGNITFQSEGEIAPRVTLAIERYGSSDYNISIYQGQYSYSFDMPNDATGYHFIVRIDQNRSEYVGTAKVTFSNIMLNLGSTLLPYEPYGYKIPISSASTTTPVYLGEAQTTRKVKKLVLTGKEEFVKSELSGNNAFLAYILEAAVGNTNILCTHYEADNTNRNRTVYIRTPIYGRVCFIDNSFQDETGFKSYLATQYAAGTPVTVWYVLATEETGIVNEPLMKIGEYADTISGITVPTITGKDTFDVETTLKPSEVSISYTGWHDVTVEEWDGSQWNE